MFAELLKEQTGLFFYFFYFLYQILLYYSRICSYRVFCVKIFIWMNCACTQKHTHRERDLDQNSILISAVVFREEKLDLDVTLMISAVLSCNHLTCLAQVHKE